MGEYSLEQNNQPSRTSSLPALPSNPDRFKSTDEGSFLKWLLYSLLAFILLIILAGAGLAGYTYYKHGNFDVLGMILPDNNQVETIVVPDENTNNEAEDETKDISEEEVISEDEEITEDNNKLDDLLLDPIEPENYGTCVDQGGEISTTTIRQGRPSACCVGLNLILEQPDRFDKGYCLNCGNGICESPETYNNCPSDCIKEMSPKELTTDSDADGLMDFEEDWYDTNPKNNDTDADGYSDGVELELGYDPGGYGPVAPEATTPEGAIFALEYAKVKCEQAKTKDNIYFSGNDLERLITYYSVLEEWDDTVREDNISELKEELIDDFLDPRVYVNRVKKISFLNRQPINAVQLALSYEVIYSPDDRGFAPSPQYHTLVLFLRDNEWLYDLAATGMEEIENADVGAAKSRDAKRVADIKQIQTALELYFIEARTYPESIMSGKSISYNDNIYLLSVPINSQEADGSCPADFDYTYTSKDGGQSYDLEYCLGVGSGDIPAGINIASPEGLTAGDASRQPIYKTCYFDAGSRDNARIADIKELQTTLELYYNDASSYPEYILPGIPLKKGEVTYLAGMPKNPPAESGSCELYSEYSYNQTDEGQAYELRYCLEKGVGLIPAGVNTASPSGISE